MKTWINDYGDIPWWYWRVAREVWLAGPGPEQRRQGRLKAQTILGTLMGLGRGIA